MTGTVADLGGMLAGMTPTPVPGVVHFCKVGFDDPRLAELATQALCTFREVEDMTLILTQAQADAAGLAGDQPMAQITLGVYSSLEGVGLTAAVATALAEAGIACNMVAAFHHDHAFVPAAQVDDAMAVLTAISSAARA
ncbi:ACT domain-containing protein [Yoonia sp. R2331]|uniref:ACT domain-containing protein n=1 Tax=Yoonia sp. R2331 TaxID=3237238 RepID=UPI0034E39967